MIKPFLTSILFLGLLALLKAQTGENDVNCVPTQILLNLGDAYHNLTDDAQEAQLIIAFHT